MKNIITLLFALVAFTINAQSDSTRNQMDTTLNKIDTAESTEFDFGNVKVIIKDKKKKIITKDENWKKDKNKEGDYTEEDDSDEYPNVSFATSFGIGVAGYSQSSTRVDDGPISLSSPISNTSLDLNYGKSRNYMINGNLMFDIHKNFGILTGLGVEFNRFVFNENLQVTPNEGNFKKDTVISFGSYKFKTNYLNIPLMLVFKSNNQKFKFAVGGTFSYNIGSKVKQEYSIENVDYKSTIKGSYNVAPIKLSLGARIAYKGIGLYVNYGLTEMNKHKILRNNNAIDLTHFSAGITLGGL
jgi:opacity protein-like surface antigen